MNKITLLWIFAALISLPIVFADCTPGACPVGTTDNGISCNATDCVRDCTVLVCDNSTWSLDSSSDCDIYDNEANADEEYCQTATYTPTNTSKCYKFVYDRLDEGVDMDVNESEDCFSEAIAGFVDLTSTSNPWFENLSYYIGYVSSDEPSINYLLETMRAGVDGGADDNYKEDTKTYYEIYCSPTEYSCDNLSDFGDDCDTNCYNHQTRVNVVQGYYQNENGDHDETLYENARCGAGTVTQNWLKNNDFRVYSTTTSLINDDQACEIYTPLISNVNVIYENSTAGDDIVCNYTFSDPHNFIEQNSTYEWWRNGTNQNIDSQILMHGNLTPYDEWFCKVIPHNGVENGTQAQSNNNLTVLSTVKNPKFYIEDTLFWEESGYFSDKRTILNFSTELQTELNNCVADDEGYCNLSLTFYSDDVGKLNISKLNIYHYNPTGDANPTVSLISPEDNSNSTNTTLTFNCSVIDDYQLVNVSLYHDLSGTWMKNSTVSLTGLSDSASWTFDNMTTGFYKWNCLAYDNGSLFDWGDNNYSIDTAFHPTIYSISVTPNPQGFGENVTIEANITDSDNNIDTVLLGITPSGESETNYTLNNISEDIWQYNFTDFTNGTYIYAVYVNDSTGQIDSNSSTFDMYINLYSNIKTLKDSYTDDEFVNITDPPEDAASPYNPNMLITRDTAWTVLTQEYLSKLLDFKFIYLDDNNYRLDWEWDNEDTRKEFMNCANTVPSFQTECLKELHVKYFDEYNFGTLRSDISYLKNHPMPKSIVKGNAKLLGDITPFDQEEGSININLEDGFYKSNGLRIKFGFNTTLAEFNNSKTAENLTFTEAGNITRYLKIEKSSIITSSTIDLIGYETVVQGTTYSVNDTSQSDGMATKAGDYFWIANAGTDYVYKFGKTNNIVSSWDISGATGNVGEGMDWDGTYFWTNIDGSPEEVYKFTDAWVKSSGFSIDAESGNPSGIVHYNSLIYVADRSDDKIYKYNTAGTLQETINLNSITDLYGIIKTDAYYFWGVSYPDEYFVKLNNSGHTIKYFDLSPYGDMDDPIDISYDGTDMWILDTNRPYTVWQVLIDYPTNVSIDSGNDASYDYINNSEFNGSVNDVDLNKTAIQNYLDSCTPDAEDYCYVPITFYTDTFGKLEYSDINVEYKDNESKIRNDDTKNTSVYLLMKVQYWNGTDWIDEAVIQNDASPRRIEPGVINQLKLDAIWNPNRWDVNTNTYGNGTYRAWVAATDENDVVLENNDGTSVLSTYNFSLSVSPVDNSPTVTLISPTDNYNSTITTITFNCSATDDNQLVNITLYHNISGIWEKNSTISLSGTSDSAIWTIDNIPDGNYKWNCLVYDNASQYDWGNSNFTFIVSTPSSQIDVNLNQPSNNSTISNLPITFNFSVTSDSDTKNCSLYGNFSGSWELNQTLSNDQDTSLYDDSADDDIENLWSNTSADFVFDTDHYESTDVGATEYNEYRKTTANIIGVRATITKSIVTGTGNIYYLCIGNDTFSTSNRYIENGYCAYFAKTSNGDYTDLYRIDDGTPTKLEDCNWINNHPSAEVIDLYVKNGKVILNQTSNNTACIVSDSTHTPNGAWIYSSATYCGATNCAHAEFKDVYDIYPGIQNNTITNFNDALTLSPGNYIWNVQCYNNSGQDDWGNSNFTFSYALPPNKFTIQNSSSDDVAYFDDQGNLVLAGNCTSGGSCASPPVDSYIIQNSTGFNVSYIDADGNLCVSTGDCSDQSASCNPSNDAFIVQDSSDNNVSYIDVTGDLCLTGTLVENGNP